MLLSAAALATSRIRLGTLVTPVARRRPQQLARQVATLDAVSGGRVIFAAGLGGPIEDEYGSFGESTDPIVRILAAPPTDAARRPLGRRGPVVHRRRAWTCSARRPGSRPGRLHPPAPQR
jgi:luciferase-like monooxygenase